MNSRFINTPAAYLNMPEKIAATLLVLIFLTFPVTLYARRDAEPIDISPNNNAYWFYKGKEVLLLGGSVQDNLFQIPGLAEHLDLLESVGGNYVRNTMSSRDSGNVWPFHNQDDGLYDLNRFNEEYWRRFETFLGETAKRDIIVQIEIWATFDYYRDVWDINPFNPKNNINYEPRRSKLPETVETHPIFTENNFFRSVPSQMALAQVLWYQQQFVDKILSYSLGYDHVLYCMDNETSVTSDWGKYWANYIQKKAGLAGKKVHTTEMWDPWDLSHPFHLETFDNPDIFTFVDISQNNHQTGDAHWNNGLATMARINQMGNARPVNNVKIYGNDGGAHKTTRDATENFVKNILMGCASARFHRPTSGQGLNERAQSVIKSMRELSGRMDFFNGNPCNDRLHSRENGEAYCRGIPGKEYAVYFPAGGVVELDLGDFRAPSVEWLNLLSSEWLPAVKLESSSVRIKTPDGDHWIALIVASGN
jgi:hypothetical protein